MNKLFFAALTLALIFPIANYAGESLIWSVNSREDVLRGEARGVSVNDNGSITLAPRLEELYSTGQPFVWSSAVDQAGNFFLGTGGDGKIYRVAPGGQGSLFYDTAELNVSALAIAGGGTVFAGTSPDGKVYRIKPDGTGEIYFEPQEKYIWSLAVLSDGSLAVGTGEAGKIYKVSKAGASPADALFFDTSETHIISLAAGPNGTLYAGTDAEGLVLSFSAEGKPFALLDSPLREIHEIAVGVDGSIYALALSESVSIKQPATDEAKKEAKTVSVDKKTAAVPAPAADQKSRYDLSTAKSAVYRILPDGGNDIIWKSEDIAAFSLYAHLTGNGVLIGTSDKGRIYSVRNDGQVKLTLQTGEEQVSTIKTHGNRLFATTSNQGKLFRFGGERLAEGTFESAVLDAKSVANWGTIWWRAEGDVVLQTRSGNTSVPNETWSEWSGSLTDQRGQAITSPKAQFLQWRAVLKNSPREATLNEVNVAFQQRNIPPEVLSIEILPANVGLAPNPPVPVDPNILSLGLDPADFGINIPPPVPRRVFQNGARSLQWKADDRNGDKLRYAIYYRNVADPQFKLLREGLEATFYTIDGLALADGRYVFKIVASDLPSNPAADALQGEKISEPFDVDNTAPVVASVGPAQITNDNISIVFRASENAGYITRAEYNVNGGEWKTVFADDGLSDSKREDYTVRFAAGPGEYKIGLRVFDSSGNVGNARVTVNK